ncbi:hypothetical protein RP20_CCG015177 [Aedes albopictus]|nr:hypothetical protein RP20_CCG015177 [Aedes albopictus]
MLLSTMLRQDVLKKYPYPQALKEEVERQINKLLNDGIIQPSKSPYNSPIWVVPKKTDASNEKKYRPTMESFSHPNLPTTRQYGLYRKRRTHPTRKNIV